MRQAIYPPALAKAVRDTGFSPAVRAGDFLYLTGATGGDSNGTMVPDVATQTTVALTKAVQVIKAAGGDADSVVEITSYHTDIADNFAGIQSAIGDVLGLPLPAWTAVEVADLRRAGALIELRIVAYLGEARNFDTNPGVAVA